MAEKGGLGLLIGVGPKPGDDEGGEDDAKTLAAKGLIKAVKAGDSAGVADAFQQLYDACGHKEMGESEEE